jgi:hypothetical protein
MTTSQNRDIIDHMLSTLETMTECDHASDLHHYLCNEDYFIVGSFRARQWIGDEAFSIIDKIKEYEESNFGAVTTDFSEPEKVANMYCYMKGEEILQHANTLQGKWDGALNRQDLQDIGEEIDAIPAHTLA